MMQKNNYYTFFLFSIFSLVSLSTLAQSPIEGIPFGDKGEEKLNKMIESFDGRIWAIGQTQIVNGTSGRYAWIIKVDDDGKKTKAFRIGKNGENYDGKAIVEDNKGRIIVGGIATSNKSDNKTWLACFDSNGEAIWEKVIKTSSTVLTLDDLLYDPIQNQLVATGITKNSIWINRINLDGNIIKETLIHKADLTSLIPRSAKIEKIGKNYYLYGTLAYPNNKTNRKEPFLAKLDAEGDLINPGMVTFPSHSIESINSMISLNNGRLALFGTTDNKGRSRNDAFFFRIDTTLKKTSEVFTPLEQGQKQEGIDIAFISENRLYAIGSGITKMGADNGNIIIYQLDENGKTIEKKRIIGGKFDEAGAAILFKKNGSLWIGGIKDVGNIVFRNYNFYLQKIEQKLIGHQEENTINLSESILFRPYNNEKIIKRIHEVQKDQLTFVIENKSNEELKDAYLQIVCNDCKKGLKINQAIPVKKVLGEKNIKINIPIWTEEELEEGKNKLDLLLYAANGQLISSESIEIETYQRIPFQTIDFTFDSSNKDTVFKDKKITLTARFLNTHFETIEKGSINFKFPKDVIPYETESITFEQSNPKDTLIAKISFRVSPFLQGNQFVIPGYIELVDRNYFFNFKVTGNAKEDLAEEPVIVEEIKIPPKVTNEKISTPETNAPIVSNNSIDNRKLEIEWDGDLDIAITAKSLRENYEIKVDINSNFEPDEKYFSIVINDSIKISLNGRKADEVDLKKRQRGEKKFRSYLTTIVNLSVGINKIEVMYKDEKNLSEKTLQPLYVKYIPNDKGTLYVLSIGIPDPNKKLKYSTKDAQDFANLFNNQKGKLFQNIEIYTLNQQNDNTSALGISSFINKNIAILGKNKRDVITKKDGIIIFLSGHGYIDDNGNFRIPGNSFDPDNEKYTSIDFREDVESKLENLDCPKWVFVDACRSGFISPDIEKELGRKNLGEVSYAEEINKRTTASSNIRSISSCGPKEYSYEDETWSNGAFTEVLINILSDKALCKQLDKDGNKSLSLSEIYHDVQSQVKQLVKGKRNQTQTPYYNFTSENDVSFFAY